MKKYMLLAFVAGLGLMACGSTEKKNDSLAQISEEAQERYQKYPFRTAIVTYDLSGNTQGSKTLYIDDYGYREATIEETTMAFMGVKETEKKKSISVGSTIITIDSKKGSATKTSNPFAKAYANEVGADYIALGESVLESLGYEKVGQEKVLGKSCDVWKGMNTLWTWKGLTLKTETKMVGMTLIETATKIDLDASVSDSHFEIPDGVAVTEVSNPFEGMLQMGDLQESMSAEMTDEDREMMQKMKKMSFSEWKKLVTKNDPEMAEMSEEELRQVYTMMKKFTQE
ncbi:hypothetical protein [Sediminicola luteus]|uniref:DUF4412 domain-containing protein n=1 Tax=Sediminicola luteus TaxID=319238 RepID=A0A2A4GES0_9FLAO|nr:hypothetical protein [Sediminicola luteus]PCE66285.1 hypothetical protein B7P33_03020 [Sediminicola luteus]